MHPYISLDLAAERARELQREASATRLARQIRRGRQARLAWQARLARQTRRGRLTVPAAPQAGVGRCLPYPVSPPGSNAAFLLQASGPLVREPSAAERACGQSVG